MLVLQSHTEAWRTAQSKTAAASRAGYHAEELAARAHAKYDAVVQAQRSAEAARAREAEVTYLGNDILYEIRVDIMQ